MDRAEKRRLDRSNTKNQKWFENLPLDKKIFIGNLIEKETSINDNILTDIMDRCFKSAIDDNIEINNEELNKIIKESNDYIAEYKEYLDKEGYMEGFNMIENVELRDQVTTKIKEYMSKNIDKAKSLRLLKKEFNLPNAELSDLWLSCKNETVNKYDKAMGVEPKEIVVDSEIKKKSKLKVISTVKEVEGEYGTYFKSATGVSIDNKQYKDVAEVNAENDILTNEYLDIVKSINKQIKHLNAELRICNETHELKCKKYDELRDVFDL